MKRSPIQRRTPLLPRTGALARSAALTRSLVARKRKRVARTPDEVRARRLVRQRSGGVCEVCGRAPSTNFQHRRATVHGGTWCPTNGLDVCGMGNVSGCHGRIHQHAIEAYANGWSVRSGHSPETTPVVIAGRGRVLLTRDGGTTPIERSAA